MSISIEAKKSFKAIQLTHLVLEKKKFMRMIFFFLTWLILIRKSCDHESMQRSQIIPLILLKHFQKMGRFKLKKFFSEYQHFYLDPNSILNRPIKKSR